MVINQITERIIGAAIQVHRTLGPGLLESTYETCLEYELIQAGLGVERQYPVPLRYQGVSMDCGFRIDLLVERKVVVEVKAVARLEDVHRAQVKTYLKLCGAEVGLLMNFNEYRLMDGVDRIVEGYRGPTPRFSAFSALNEGYPAWDAADAEPHGLTARLRYRSTPQG